jgi:tripartite-type tricarboxylate transporter receptor subunit TctC
MNRLVAVASGLLFGIATAFPLQAQQSYPSRDITFIVPWAAGGSNDVMARALQPILKEQGIGIIIENVAGANGTIGMRRVMTAPADGYMVGLNTSSTLAAIAQGKTALDNEQFTYLNRVSVDPLILVVPAGSPHQNLASFLAYMKANPGKVSVGTPGTNNVNHILAAMTARAAGVDYVNVPYAGGSKVLADLLGGHVNAGVLKPAETLSQIQEKLIRPIGVYGEQRIQALPDVPTFKEQGIDVYPFGPIVQMGYLVGPAKLPDQIRDRLTTAFRKAILDPRFKAVAQQNSFLVDDLSGEALRAEVARVAATLQDVGAQVFTKDGK